MASTQDMANRASESGGKAYKVLYYPNDLGMVSSTDYIHYILFNISIRDGVTELRTTDSSGIETVDGTVRNSVADQPGISKRSNVQVQLIGGNAEGQNSNVPNLAASTTRIATSIAMYMPPSLQVNYGANWQTQDLGLLGSMLTGSQNLINDFKQGKALSANLGNMDSYKNAGITGALLTADAASTLGIEGVKSAIEKASGSVLNPYTEVLFQNVNNRTFSFTFKFQPSSPREAAIVRNIIAQFKYHSMPSMVTDEGGSASRLLFPSEFDIGFYQIDPDQGISAYNTNLFKMDRCALTSVDVNYAPNGAFRTFKDGMPVEIDMTLNFTEMTTLTKEKIAKGY